MTAGRPSDYTPDIANSICVKLAEGMSLREICRDDAMPGRTTVLRWLNEREEFRGQYATAREAQADYMADEILEIADDAVNDYMERKHGETNVVTVNGEAINRSRLRVDARKWLLSKLLPKKYGDRVTHAGDPDSPLNPPSDPRELSKAVLAIMDLLRKGVKDDEPSRET